MYGVFGREKEAPEEMQGIGHSHVLAPDRNALYTLYLRPPTATSGTAESSLRAEVHTLSLDGGWAHCVDLPAGFADGGGVAGLSGSAIAVSPDGGHVYVVDGRRGQLVEIETQSLVVTRTVTVALSNGNGAGPEAMAVGGTGRIFVGDGSSVVVLSAASLAPLARWATDAPVRALAATDNGGVVAAVGATAAGTATGIDQFDAQGQMQRRAHSVGEVLTIDQLLSAPAP